MPSCEIFSQTQPDRVILRPEKGLKMEFFANCVIKQYSDEPEHPSISREEQTRRMRGEIAAYNRFKELQCPFTPELLEASVKQRWFAISRIHGNNLLELLQTENKHVVIPSIFHQIDEMNHWLRRYGFGPLGNNIKDFILDSTGKLYLVDFEMYSSDSQKRNQIDLYDSIIHDILERILIRKGRKARLTRTFLRFSLSTFLKKPIMTMILVIRCLLHAFLDTKLSRKVRKIWNRRLK